MTEFFSRPNQPTPEELRAAARHQREEAIQRARRIEQNTKFRELRTASATLAQELRAKGSRPPITLLETPKSYRTGFLMQKITGKHWRYDEPSTLGRGWVISAKHHRSEGAQDGYAASINGSGSSTTRTIVLTEDARLLVGRGVERGTLSVWGELEQTTFQLCKHENAVQPYYDGGLFKSVDIDEFERDLRTSGRELLGY